MIASELINPVIPTLSPDETAAKALAWMEELHLNELPVVGNGLLEGLLRHDHVPEENIESVLVSQLQLVDKKCFVFEHQHFYDVIKAASDFHVHSVPVLNQENNYIGTITVEETMAAFAQTAAVQSPGAILILTIKQIDYSLAEVSRLIESDGVKVLSSSVNNDLHDPSQIKLTLKVNKTDLSRIIATLERFGYNISASFQETEFISNDKERLDLLLRYLDI